jgi:predicted DNA-binding protein
MSTMSKQWVAKRKLVSLNQKESEALSQLSKQVGRTETDILREAFREYLKKKGIVLN